MLREFAPRAQKFAPRVCSAICSTQKFAPRINFAPQICSACLENLLRASNLLRVPQKFAPRTKFAPQICSAHLKNLLRASNLLRKFAPRASKICSANKKCSANLLREPPWSFWKLPDAPGKLHGVLWQLPEAPARLHESFGTAKCHRELLKWLSIIWC